MSDSKNALATLHGSRQAVAFWSDSNDWKREAVTRDASRPIPTTTLAEAERLLAAIHETMSNLPSLQSATMEATKFLSMWARTPDIDREVWLAIVSEIFSEYPIDVVRSITNHRDGLPARQKWFPEVSEIRSALNAELERLQEIRDGYEAIADKHRALADRVIGAFVADTAAGADEARSRPAGPYTSEVFHEIGRIKARRRGEHLPKREPVTITADDVAPFRDALSRVVGEPWE